MAATPERRATERFREENTYCQSHSWLVLGYFLSRASGRLVKKHQGTAGLILSGSRYFVPHRQVREKGFYIVRSHFGGMPLAVKGYETRI